MSQDCRIRVIESQSVVDGLRVSGNIPLVSESNRRKVRESESDNRKRLVRAEGLMHLLHMSAGVSLRLKYETAAEAGHEI